jgi:two-component system, OmpR family, alkaline phosphatase synthesis response regulator PhoP
VLIVVCCESFQQTTHNTQHTTNNVQQTTDDKQMTTPKKILVADDESHILHVVSLKLTNAGYTVITASDGQEAYELATADRPDLLITDYHMPQLSGLELCRKLRQSTATSGIPTIMLTARGYALEPGDTEQNGILQMLSKPFSPRQLLLTVNELLGVTAAAA